MIYFFLSGEWLLEYVVFGLAAFDDPEPDDPGRKVGLDLGFLEDVLVLG